MTSLRRTFKQSSVLGATVALMTAAVGAPAVANADTAPDEQLAARVSGPEQSLVLDFSGAGERVVIDDRAHRVVWRGSDASARLPLPYSATADLVVASLDSGTATAVAGVQATNPDPKSLLTPLTSVTTSARTTMSWARSPEPPRMRCSKARTPRLAVGGRPPTPRSRCRPLWDARAPIRW